MIWLLLGIAIPVLFAIWFWVIGLREEAVVMWFCVSSLAVGGLITAIVLLA